MRTLKAEEGERFHVNGTCTWVTSGRWNNVGKGSRQNGSVTSGKGLARGPGTGVPGPEPVGCRWTARACSRGESGSPRAGRGTDRERSFGDFPRRRTAASNRRIHQVLDCSPTNREREPGLDRRETKLATHPTLCIFTCLPCHALGLPCLALALACLGFGLPCLGLALALPCLAMSCLRLGMPCVGIALLCVALACRALACLGLGNGIAPIKLFRESEAIGSLARHGLGLALACAFRESEAIGSLAWRGL
ncbi:unnamed protein product, partial [Prunus brigantina]